MADGSAADGTGTRANRSCSSTLPEERIADQPAAGEEQRGVCTARTTRPLAGSITIGQTSCSAGATGRRWWPGRGTAVSQAAAVSARFGRRPPRTEPGTPAI